MAGVIINVTITALYGLAAYDIVRKKNEKDSEGKSRPNGRVASLGGLLLRRSFPFLSSVSAATTTNFKRITGSADGSSSSGPSQGAASKGSPPMRSSVNKARSLKSNSIRSSPPSSQQDFSAPSGARADPPAKLPPFTPEGLQKIRVSRSAHTSPPRGSAASKPQYSTLREGAKSSSSPTLQSANAHTHSRSPPLQPYALPSPRHSDRVSIEDPQSLLSPSQREKLVREGIEKQSVRQSVDVGGIQRLTSVNSVPVQFHSKPFHQVYKPGLTPGEGGGRGVKEVEGAYKSRAKLDLAPIPPYKPPSNPHLHNADLSPPLTSQLKMEREALEASSPPEGDAFRTPPGGAGPPYRAPAPAPRPTSNFLSHMSNQSL